MGFSWFYIIALFPMMAWFVAWLISSQKLNPIVCIGASVSCFIIAGICHALFLSNMTTDEETWSGQITHARQFSAWKEYYEEAVYRTETRTVGSGKNKRTESYRVFDHWEPTSRHHAEYWMCYSNIDTEYYINETDFQYYIKKFNHKASIAGSRTTMEHNSRMIGGDPYDYVSQNKTGWIQPITKRMHFENRIKASPSVFSFITVPEAIKVFSYPDNGNPFNSNRVLGEASKKISLLCWDQMNARLGISKKVNVIIVGFTDSDSYISEYQRAKWLGGKKNDLILCYGNGWAKVFGWTEKEDVKQNLETLLLDSKIDDSIIPLIESEIRSHYIIKDWKKFNYLSVEPRSCHFTIYLIILLIVHVGTLVGSYYSEVLFIPKKYY